MDIAALSMGLSQMKVSQSAGLAVMKMAMNQATGESIDILELLDANSKMLELSVIPSVGSNFDASV